MDGGAWWAVVHGVAKSRTQLSDFTFTFYFPALETEMATHSSVLAWRIPGTAELGGLPSMGSHRVGHDWSDLAAERPSVLRFMGSQRVRHDWATELNWTEYSIVWIYTALYLSTHRLKDNWVVSKFWLLWAMLLWTFVYKFFYEHMFSTLFST